MSINIPKADLFFISNDYLLIDTFLVIVLFPTVMFKKYNPLLNEEASNW